MGTPYHNRDRPVFLYRLYYSVDTPFEHSVFFMSIVTNLSSAVNSRVINIPRGYKNSKNIFILAVIDSTELSESDGSLVSEI
jgi:hypothetical protein